MTMTVSLPRPVSGGIILSYKCPAACRHCIYACSPKWPSDWLSREDLEKILKGLAGGILPPVSGPGNIGLNDGIHFTGGEPFLNFELLCIAVEMAEKLKIPSVFVETNCYWATDDKTVREKLRLLKKKGMRGIMISVNPFYLEYVPFARTERAIEIASDIFGRNAIVYQIEYYRRFREWGLGEKVPFEEYLKLEREGDLLRNVEFFPSGRAPYSLKGIIGRFLPRKSAEAFFGERCLTPFLRGRHNHFDNYGNYIPGFCGGISLGDCRNLNSLLERGIDASHYSVLGYLLRDDIEGLYRFTGERGYKELSDGYVSKCHLCIDLRKYLVLQEDFPELSPKEFYLRLEG